MSGDDVTEQIIDETEGDSFVLVDPGDYAESQKIRSIFRAERAVKKFTGDRGGFTIREESQLAGLVRTFLVEMWPVIVDSIEAGIITEEDVAIPSKRLEYEDIRGFVQSDRLDNALYRTGQSSFAGNEMSALRASVSMWLFNHVSMLKQKLGLGMSIDRDRAPAEV
jgi:hypothetical protein